MNKVILSGNLCKDIELKYTTSNKSVLQNTIAVRNDFKNKNGEYDSEFINIVVWNTSAEYLNKYASKGSKILIEGRMTNRSYEKQDGTKGYVTEVICDRVELLNTKLNNNGQTIQKLNTEEEKEIIEDNDPFKDFGEQIEADLSDNYLD